MAKKVFKTAEFKLHILTSRSGVIGLKLVDKKSHEILEERFFSMVNNDLEDYVTSVGFDLELILNYLNNI